MNVFRIRTLAILILGLFMVSPIAFAKKKKKYHCEKEKKGKVVDLPKIKSRKKCKKAGGKWVKEHGHGHKDHKHDHDHDDHDHKDGDHDHDH